MSILLHIATPKPTRRPLGSPCAVACESASQRELAKVVGVSTGGIHYVLNALVEKGMLKLSNITAAEDKRRYAYVLTPQGIAEKVRLTRRFMIRKLAEYEALKAEIEEVRGDLSEQEVAEIRAELKTGN